MTNTFPEMHDGMTSSPDAGEGYQTSFARNVNEYVRSHTLHADQKATFNFIVVSTFLTFIVHQSFPANPMLYLARWVVIFLLSAAALFAFLSIFPRYDRKISGLVHWPQIAQYGTLDDYVARLYSLRHEDTTREFAANAYTLSKICVVKFRWLRWAMTSAVIGITLYFATVVTAIHLPKTAALESNSSAQVRE